LAPTEAEVREIVRRVLARLAESPAPGSAGAHSGLRRTTGRTMIDESAVRALAPGSRLAVPKGALVTPLARQVAQERGVVLDEGSAAVTPARASASAASPQLKVAIGADHGGFPLKEALKPHLQSLGYEVIDCGTNAPKPSTTPTIAYAVAQLVA
jgi:hypothetical protein